MVNGSPANRVPPAKGLTFLTWAQIEEIDARLAAAAIANRNERRGGILGLFVNENGRLIGVGMVMAIEKVNPTH